MAGKTKQSPIILVINPGSTSTKIALFVGLRCRCESELKHDPKALAAVDGVIAQKALRREAISQFLEEHKFGQGDIDVFIGRGGLLRPLTSGVYQVNGKMIADLQNCRYGEHASNLGAILAVELARPLGKGAYIANPVVVDELSRRRPAFRAIPTCPDERSSMP